MSESKNRQEAVKRRAPYGKTVVFDAVLTCFAVDFKHGATPRARSLCAFPQDRRSVESIEGTEGQSAAQSVWECGSAMVLSGTTENDYGRPRE